jgi:hypothetical protein
VTLRRQYGSTSPVAWSSSATIVRSRSTHIRPGPECVCASLSVVHQALTQRDLVPTRALEPSPKGLAVSAGGLG